MLEGIVAPTGMILLNISDINPVTFGNAVSYRCPAI